MVGLRWWNRIKDDGSNEWVYESLEDTSQVGKADASLFWGALLITPLIWCVSWFGFGFFSSLLLF